MIKKGVPTILVLVAILLTVTCLLNVASRSNARAKVGTAKVIVLSFHGIGEGSNDYTVSLETFLNNVQLFVNRGYRFVDFADYEKWLKGSQELPEKAVLLTFDDGMSSDYDIVFPYLKEKGIKAGFFPVINFIDKNGHLTSEQIREMSESGLCSFGTHSVSHKNLLFLDQEGLEREIGQSKLFIEKLTQQGVVAFAYPFGFWNEKVKDVLISKGYHLAFTAIAGINVSTTNPYEIRRILFRKNQVSEEIEVLINGTPAFYQSYYEGLFLKAKKNGLNSIARVCEEELGRL